MIILRIFISKHKNPTSAKKFQGIEVEPGAQNKMAGSLYDTLMVAKMVWLLVTYSLRRTRTCRCGLPSYVQHGPSHNPPTPGQEERWNLKESALHQCWTSHLRST